ncbi:UDP-N-acetylmuramoyl-L-alanine--D-glutamate ligase [Tissierella sp. MSJ-40]|uniref:UDP-N-acetylmuramoylalanine--D-glutamate ligase n=1 Tax=Tissierella simiarum TaxID=2841534 RepID=A0ABS6E5X2_9FIRM|nr:UDP-N-acetylmuramoyl-L-alanine--D-glutamate ligase [Tissierella simiarum]MBU5438177.1 UDP-N-acetylmuramoyl-L-alanine--D-glutamate ligase [Tissierella simiarum]
MYLKDKRVLILGLGISGVSTVKALNKLGSKLIISDSKSEEELKDFLTQIKDIDLDKYLNTNDVPLEGIDLIIKSPGIPPTANIIKKAKSKNIEVITDIELAYRVSPTKNIIAITGTNGKTTTTTLVGKFFNKANFNTHVAGNIGVGILWDMVNAKEEDVFVIEVSSFQLDNTIQFKPKVSLIINITPDHLNWHGSIENYVDAKKKIFKNQDESDFVVLNYDDITLRNMGDEINSNVIWFSVNNILDKGVYIEDEYIVIKDEEKITKVLPYKDIKMLGKHNLENALGSIGIGWIMGLDVEIMAEVLRTFPGVEHRIEFVSSIDGINFYNDSKGTNPDASIKAIEAINSPIILIAGGLDKGSDFGEYISSFNGKVKALILLGQTKEKIKSSALDKGYKNIFTVESMEEAVNLSYELGDKGDNVLLSPACASWDMYKSFEDRGKDFKKVVYSLKEE